MPPLSLMIAQVEILPTLSTLPEVGNPPGGWAELAKLEQPARIDAYPGLRTISECRPPAKAGRPGGRCEAMVGGECLRHFEPQPDRDARGRVRDAFWRGGPGWGAHQLFRGHPGAERGPGALAGGDPRAAGPGAGVHRRPDHAPAPLPAGRDLGAGHGHRLWAAILGALLWRPAHGGRRGQLWHARLPAAASRAGHVADHA